LTRVKFGRTDNIRGKTIAITGAARGIGYATAKALLARGARVVIGDRDVALQESAVAGLTKLGPVSGYPLDVTDRESFATFLDKARTDGGGHIEVLINNAGVMPIGPFLKQSEQAIRSSIEVNLYGVLTGCQLALPDMVARRRGHIVNIASLSGLIPVPGQVVYVGAKFGVVGLSAALADEMAPHGVEVSVVMRTFTNTEPIAGSHTSAAQKPIEPEDIAAAVVKCWTSRPPWCRSPLRCDLSARSVRLCRRRPVAGCPTRWATTRCSCTSMRRPGRATSSVRIRRKASCRPSRPTR
jgi:NAD(P)-dependent dehydrogenase (short-subunit alcohol dehydrogenase family)